MKKLWQDRDWLCQKYTVEGLTAPQIAAEAGCKAGIVYHWLHKHQIPIRCASEKSERIVQCSYCGKAKETTIDKVRRNKRHFCNRECQARYDAARVTLICARCGKEFSNYQSNLKNSLTHYCSRACRKNKVILPCAACGKPVEKNRSRIARNKGGQVFCNLSCKGQWSGENVRGEYHPLDQKVEVVCASCGAVKRVSPSVVREKNFCDLACASAWRVMHIRGEAHPNWKGRIEVQCETCSKILLRPPASLKYHSHFFCSQSCAGRWRSEHQRGENSPAWKEKIPVQCGFCGKTKMFPPSRLKRAQILFCGMGCYTKWQSENRTGQNNPTYHRVEVECMACGRHLLRTLSTVAQTGKNFCSKSCYVAWTVGPNSPGWRGGYGSKRGPNWRRQANKARHRDHHTCRYCGKNHRRGERLFPVHHIVPFRNFEYVPGVNENYREANQLSNLITLCPRCHSHAEFGKILVQPCLSDE